MFKTFSNENAGKIFFKKCVRLFYKTMWFGLFWIKYASRILISGKRLDFGYALHANYVDYIFIYVFYVLDFIDYKKWMEKNYIFILYKNIWNM